jgi:hypothetical protein
MLLPGITLFLTAEIKWQVSNDLEQHEGIPSFPGADKIFTCDKNLTGNNRHYLRIIHFLLLFDFFPVFLGFFSYQYG